MNMKMGIEAALRICFLLFLLSASWQDLKKKTIKKSTFQIWGTVGVILQAAHIFSQIFMGTEKMDTKQEQRNKENEEIREMGTMELGKKGNPYGIQLLTIIGEIEGHENVSGNTKATKYEHLLPRLAEAEENDEIEGVLILLNTMGGDVEAGLGIAEMIASLGKPTVSLVLGGSHSIGGPLAVSADYSFIVPSGTMIIHPVRSSGMFIGVIQSYRNMERTQDRITRFIATHSHISQERIVELMLDSTQLVKDVGTMLEGKRAVEEGLIDEVGGIRDALNKLHEMIDEKMENTDKNYEMT